MQPRTPILLTAALLGALAGCKSPWYGARFSPAPLEAQVLAEGEPLGQARVLITVNGIRRASSKRGLPVEVELLMRLDNMGEADLALSPENLDLVAADLASFSAPRIEPAAGGSIEPGAHQIYLVSFPLPEGKTVDDIDWSGLNLRWTVSFEEREVTTGVTFDRWLGPDPWGYGYYDPYWPASPPPRTHMSVGVGVGGTL